MIQKNKNVAYMTLQKLPRGMTMGEAVATHWRIKGRKFRY